MRIYVVLLLVLVAAITNAQIKEVSFTNDTLTLSGSLYLPEGVGPFPAAILVHGSGAVNRYQTIFFDPRDGNLQCLYPDLINDTIQNFKYIAEHLYKKGIAVLVYDKRSFTYNEVLDPVTVSTKDFVSDIEHAIDYLSEQPKISADNIFLIGHSQGSALIPIAAQNKKVAGLISLSGAVTLPDTLVAEQYRNLYVICNDDSLSGSIAANRFYREFEKLRNNELADTIPITIRIPGGDPSEPFEFGYPIFWKDWIDMAENVIDNYTFTNLPTLFIHGDDDFNVPLNDVYRFENALPAALTTVEVFEGINHLLTTATSPNVSPLILTSISRWINENSSVATAIEESQLDTYFDIRLTDGRLQIQALNHQPPIKNFKSLLVSAVDGRILHQAKLQQINTYSLPINTSHKMVVLSLLGERQVFSQVIRAD